MNVTNIISYNQVPIITTINEHYTYVQVCSLREET